MRNLLVTAFVSLLSTSVAAEINVSYTKLAQTTAYESERVYAGRVVASRAAELGFKVNGRIANVMVDLGQSVMRGQPLAQVDGAELAANKRNAEANVALALANIGAMEAEVLLARNTEQRFRRLREAGHTPKQTYDETYLNLRVKRSQLTVAKAQLKGAEAALDASSIALSEATILAPFTGVIQARYVDEGSQISPGQRILRIEENGILEAHIGVPGEIGARLLSGGDYIVRWNGNSHSAQLAHVLPEVDPATRTQTAVLNIVDANIPLGSSIELTVNETVSEIWCIDSRRSRPLGCLCDR